MDRLYPTEGRPWLVRVDGEPCLYLDFYEDGPAEDENWAGLFAARGGPPDASVVANISGRCDGWEPVRDVVSRLLGAFDGAATDDGGFRLWTRDEVADDRRIDGRRFGLWRE